MEPTNPLLNGYREKVQAIVRWVCITQTFVALVTAFVIWKASDYLGPKLGSAAILLTLLSIPSVAALGNKQILKYEKSGWKNKHPNLDFSGKWEVRVRFLKAFKVTRIDETPPEQHGSAVIHQSAFGLVSINNSIMSDRDGADLGGVNVLATVIAENGTTLYTVYEMTGFPEDKFKGIRSQSYGFGKIDVNDSEALRRGARPKCLKTIWYDCVQADGNEQMIFIGETTHTRPYSVMNEI